MGNQDKAGPRSSRTPKVKNTMKNGHDTTNTTLTTLAERRQLGNKTCVIR